MNFSKLNQQLPGFCLARGSKIHSQRVFWQKSLLGWQTRADGTAWRFLTSFVVIVFIASVGQPALSAEPPIFQISIKNHRFVPDVIEIPKGQKIKLEIKNEDATVEEFESHDLKREKMIPSGMTVVVFIGPLKPGSYTFFGEFHSSTARGSVVVK